MDTATTYDEITKLGIKDKISDGGALLYGWVMVAAHVYNVRGIRVALENGVRSIEHANYIDKETLGLLIKHKA